MSTGPNKLKHYHIRHILKKKIYKSVLREFNAGEIEWSDKGLASIKREIRLELRNQQEGRCIFCRRIIKIERRNANEDIEHYLDKSKRKYRRWAFCCFNLAIACHACNLEKSTRDLADTIIAGPNTAYPKGLGVFAWLHPYFDDFHENIEVGHGWTYRVKSNAPAPKQAEALIKECKLGEIQRIEAYAELVKARMLRLSELAYKALERGQIARSKRLLAISIGYQKEQLLNY